VEAIGCLGSGIVDAFEIDRDLPLGTPPVEGREALSVVKAELERPGVGEKAGSVLGNLAETHGDRIVVLHEADVTSETIRSARTRWDLRIEAYETEVELFQVVRRFVVTIMNRERFGDLEYLS
jgi:hypothetical protein